jgi:hypothetical protein
MTLKEDDSSFEEWTRNHRWFRAHYNQLARKYDSKNICVYKRSVVDYDRDLRKLMGRVRKNYPVNRVVVEFVSRRKRELIL